VDLLPIEQYRFRISRISASMERAEGWPLVSTTLGGVDLIQEHTTTAPSAARSLRAADRDLARRQARVQRELAAVQRRWAASLSSRSSGRVTPVRDGARLRAD
jgi:hypothetical protein